ncbi:MAG: hypothetical protein H6722_13950 [Sandaracinus sp.]|nr:hypothetical protein [Sandaracinus sp.]MCB9613546.1 hypothetical protein [Sandaracinus sp.]MCB9619690.1 hypothetical protein [Sandaracinus sp.]MCB9625543.1 hypothetical protein [Sandaracinus sp.]
MGWNRVWVVWLVACGGSHVVGDDAGARDAGFDSGLACATPGEIECSGGMGRECRFDHTWEEFYDGPCAPLPPDAGPTCRDDAPLESAASQASVRLRLGGTGWVVQSGSQCGAFDVAQEDGTSVPLGLGFSCVCECPAPGEPGPLALRDVATAPVELAWDGRGLRTYGRCVDCAERGWPGGGVQRVIEGAFQPLVAGRYRITLPVYDVLPDTCSVDEAGGASCSPPAGPGFPFAGYAACEAPRQVVVEVDLPSEGERIVDVDVSPPS